MLTEHRNDGEGKKNPIVGQCKSEELLTFIRGCNYKSLNNWKTWLTQYVNGYYTVEPVDQIYFSENSRIDYWKKFKSLIKLQAALIFIDPDTGLETGNPSYLKRMGREKYLLNEELTSHIKLLHQTSGLMVYQQLQRNRDWHIKDFKNKLEQVKSLNDKIFVCGYREDDLSFIFVTKTIELHIKITDIFKEYCFTSLNKDKLVVD
jgi:hypothetical protein